MRIIRPITITDAMITSCSVPETDYAAWNSATAYITGDRVILAHKIWEASAGNTNKSPDTNPGQWFEVSATNRWKAFDKKLLDQTIQAGSIQYVLTPGAMFDSLALLNVLAAEVTVTRTVPVEGEVYDITESLVIVDQVFDWYSYFFEDVETITNVVKINLPPYSTGDVTVTITGGGDVAIGEIVLGMQADIGDTQYSPSIGIVDYSTKTTDTFGNFTILERAYASKLSCAIWMPAAQADYIKRIFERYRATPLVWIGSVDPVSGENIYASMVIYGFYQSFSMIIPGPTEAGYNLEILSLT